MLQPLISIIIPTFNRSTVLMRAIDSVFNQSYNNFELIIVDDGSVDETHELLLPFINKELLKYFKIPNQGVSKARNFGVEHSVGEWITFLDSDDEWLPHKLQDQMDFLKNSPVRIVFGEEIWIRNGKRVNQKSIHKKSGGWIFSKCIQQCFIAPSSVLMEKKLFLEMGQFDEEFPVCEDYDLWLKISARHEIGFIIHPIIIKHGGHTDQLSTKFVAMDFWRIKSMLRILKSDQLTLSKEHQFELMESIKSRGHILMLGYQKHGKAEDYEIIKSILLDLN